MDALLQPSTPEPDPDTTGYRPDLTRLRRMFDDARNGTQDARAESLIDSRYWDGEQWTEDQQRKLKDRNQPAVVTNRLRSAIRCVIGVVEQGATKPRAFGRNPNDEDAADAASKTLRYISDVEHFDQLKMEALQDYLVTGTGACLIEGEANKVPVTQIRWEELFYDPRSRRYDFKDARYLGIAKWMYADDLASVFPEQWDDVEGFLNVSGPITGLTGDTWDDRPENATPWIDRKQRRVMVVEIYYREAGTWMRAMFYAGGVFEADISPYNDDDGRPTCPIEALSYHVDRENNRSGLAREMRWQQDEINMRRSVALRAAMSRQLQPINGDTNPIDVDKAKAEAADPAGVIPLGYQIVPEGNQMAGNMELLSLASNEMDRLAPSPAVVGRESADSSGRAVLARQQAGLTELARPLGRFEDFELRCYKQMFARTKQFWTAPMWVRTTDDIGTPEYLRINDPTPPMKGPDGKPMMGPDGKPMLMPAVVDIRTGQPMPQAHHMAKMDMDIIVDTVQDTPTIAAEQFNEIVRLISTNPVWAQQLQFTDIIEISSLPDKRQFIEKINQRQAAAQQAQAQQQAVAQQMGMAKFQADQGKTASETDKNASTADKNRVEAAALAAKTHVGLDLHVNGPRVPVAPVPAAQPPRLPNPNTQLTGNEIQGITGMP